MQYLVKTQTNNMILTLTEKQTLALPNYLFYFKHRTTNEVIAFVRLFATDISLFKSRYNKFQLVTNTFFLNATNGEWQYNIYEQASAVNLLPSLATTMLESGYMRLGDIGVVSYSTHSSNNTFKTR